MREGWKTQSLGDLFEIENGFAFKSADFQDFGIPVIKIKNIKSNHFAESDHSFVASRFTQERPSKVARRGDLLISMSGNRHDGSPETWVGKVAPFNQTGTFLINQRVGALRPKDRAAVNARYFGFLLSSWSFQEHFIAVATSSGGQANLSPKQILAVPIRFPPLPEQRAIAATLGALDDKIELNRKLNATLEAMARALFRDWFVDFGPTRAKMEARAPYLSPDLWSLFPDRLDAEGKPEGWEVRSIYDFSNVVYGAPFASKQFNTEGEGLPLIRIRDLATHEPGVWTPEAHPKGHLIQPGDLVVGMDGEFRLHVWKGTPAWLNQRVCHFEPLPGVPGSFLAEALIEPLAFFERGKVGTTVIHLGKGDIDTFKLLHPGVQVLEAFGQVVEPLIAATVRNAAESRTLAQTRDLLLPRLMSGDLRVADVAGSGQETAA